VVPLVVAAVAAVALLVALVGLPGGDESGRQDRADRATPAAEVTTAEPSTDPTDPLAQLARREPDDPMAMGDADAPVVLIAYSEFQCPFCGKFARDTAPVLEQKYVEDGTLRIEYRDFPYLGKESMTAALAGRAAAAQRRFWQYHDAMYAHQLPPNSGHLDEDHLAGVAEKPGLDVADFRRDMASKDARKQVTRDFQEGQAIGVTGTPTFLINGTPVVGAQPTKVFERAIESAADAS